MSWIGFLAIFFLAMIYFRQEAMLYNPELPIKYIGNNPERYRSPAERNIPFIEVSAKTKDGVTLKGWLLHQKENPKNCDTLIFFHENAGNIGLRMDWFEIIHKLGVNVMCIAYRGFSESEGYPSEAGIKLDTLAIADSALN